MICPVCQKEIPGGTLVCPGCHARAAELEAEKRLSLARERAVGALSEIFKSPIFIALIVSLLVYAVSGALITLFGLKNGFFGIVGPAIFNLIPAIFAAVSALGALKLYKSKEKISYDDAKALSEYPRVAGGYQLAYTIITGICLAFVLIVTVAVFGMLSSATDLNTIFEEMKALVELESGEAEAVFAVLEWVASVGGGIITAILFVVSAAVMTVMVFYVITYKKTKKYYEMISAAVLGKNFDKNLRYPKISLYIFGGLEVLGALTSLTTDIFSALFSLGAGAFLIISALLFEKIKSEEEKILAEIDTADEELFEIRRKTNEALRTSEEECSE